MQLFTGIPEAFILTLALAIDAFVASFGYGSNKIKIPFKSVQTINLICSAITGLGLFAGALVRAYIPSWLTTALCFIILFVLGAIKLLDSITKSIIRQHNNFNKEIAFSLFSMKFILHLYANPIEADVDGSKTLSTTEAASLAIALSLDGLTVGFGAAIGNIHIAAVILCALVTNALAVWLGCWMGNKIAKKIPMDFSFLSGIILIIMAFSKLF